MAVWTVSVSVRGSKTIQHAYICPGFFGFAVATRSVSLIGRSEILLRSAVHDALFSRLNRGQERSVVDRMSSVTHGSLECRGALVATPSAHEFHGLYLSRSPGPSNDVGKSRDSRGNGEASVLVRSCLSLQAERLLAASNPSKFKVHTLFSAAPGKIEGSASGSATATTVAARPGAPPLPPPPPVRLDGTHLPCILARETQMVCAA